MKNITQAEVDLMWFGEIPFSVRMEIVDHWPVDLAVLLLRTQPNKPHSVWGRINVAEVRNLGIVDDFDREDLRDVMQKEDAVGANECLYACEVLQARMKFDPYLLTAFATEKLLKYFEMVRVICRTQKSIEELHEDGRDRRDFRNTNTGKHGSAGEGDTGLTNSKSRVPRKCIRRNGVEILHRNG